MDQGSFERVYFKCVFQSVNERNKAVSASPVDKLLDQMLDISRLDADGLSIRLANHNLSEIVRKITAEYIMILDGDQLLLDVDAPDEDIHIPIDAPPMERALRNLLDNAIRYGKDGR
jgi:signal transduction histidine kinase